MILLWPQRCLAGPSECNLGPSSELDNVSALQSALLDDYRNKHCVPNTAFPLQKLLVPPQGRVDALKSRLQDRQACTGNAKNYCFGDTTSYCDNCGLCCIQSSGGWCCDPKATCCPADTALGGSHQGCCVNGEICDSVKGCILPMYVVIHISDR